MMNERAVDKGSVSRRIYLGDIRIADVALVVYMIAVTAFSSGSLPVQLSRVFLVCGAVTELKREKYHPSKFELWQVLFAAYVAASSLWAFDLTSARSIASTVAINAVCVMCIAYILRCDSKRVYILLVCMMVAPLLLMLNVAATDGLLAFSDSRGTDSFSANTVGMTAAFGSCLAGYCLIEKKIMSIGISGIVFLLDLIVVVLSASRKAILIVILAFVLYMLLKSRGNGAKLFFRLLIAMLVVLACFFAIMNVPFLYNMVGYRIESMIVGFFGGEGADASTSTRMGLVEHGIDFFFMSPVIGHGGANFSALDAAYFNANRGYYAHNNFIEVLTDYGLIGFVLYYWIYILMIMHSIVKIKTLSSIQLAVFSLLLTLLIVEYGFVSYYDRFFQVFLAMSYYVLLSNPSEETLSPRWQSNKV